MLLPGSAVAVCLGLRVRATRDRAMPTTPTPKVFSGLNLHRGTPTNVDLIRPRNLSSGAGCNRLKISA